MTTQNQGLYTIQSQDTGELKNVVLFDNVVYLVEELNSLSRMTTYLMFNNLLTDDLRTNLTNKFEALDSELKTYPSEEYSWRKYYNLLGVTIDALIMDIDFLDENHQEKYDTL